MMANVMNREGTLCCARYFSVLERSTWLSSLWSRLRPFRLPGAYETMYRIPSSHAAERLFLAAFDVHKGGVVGLASSCWICSALYAIAIRRVAPQNNRGLDEATPSGPGPRDSPGKSAENLPPSPPVHLSFISAAARVV